MAELIQKTDTLNEGREKLNEAIKDAEKAKTDSSEAKSTANTALANSESTQTQLDTIVIEGDSSVEAAQARVDKVGKTYDTLKDRLDTENEKVTSQLADVTLNPSSFKKTTDSDDTDSFERMMDFAKRKGFRKIIIPNNRSYTLSRPVHLNSLNDMIFDLNNAPIIWDGREDVSDDTSERTIGVFSIRGSLGSTTTEINAWDNIDLGPVMLPVNDVGRTTRCSKINVRDASGFKKNDYVVFQVGDPINSGNEDYENSFKPAIEVMTRIFEISGNDLYIDYYSPYDWSQVDITRGTITKVKAAKNVIVKNVNIHDISPYEAIEEDGINPNRLKLVSGIGIKYGTNIEIENVNGLGMKLPLVMAQYLYKGSIKKVTNKYPESHGGGEGYGVHAAHCIKVDVEDVESNGGNSVLDFSGSAFCSAKRVFGAYSIGSKMIGTHGMAEHDINFEDSVGFFKFNNGVEHFSGMSKNIILKRCKGRMLATETGYLEIKIEDSEIDFVEIIGGYNQFHFAKVEFINSKIKIGRHVSIAGHKRGINKKSDIYLVNTEVTGVEEATAGVHSTIKDFENLNVIGGVVDYSETEKPLAFRNIENINFNPSLIKNATFNVYYVNQDFSFAQLNAVGINIKIDQVYLTRNRLFSFEEIRNIDLIANISSNNVTHLTDYVFNFTNLNLDRKENTNISLAQNGNIFKSAHEGMLRVSNKNFKDSNVSINKFAYNNVFIKASAQTGFNSTNYTEENIYPAGSLDIEGSMPNPRVFENGTFGVRTDVDRLHVTLNEKWIELLKLLSGNTDERPESAGVGTLFFDRTLGKPIFYKGSGVWVDADGSDV